MFNRIFGSGHNAAADQPETVYGIIERNMENLDIATGKQAAGKGCDYQTQGPKDSWSWNNNTVVANVLPLESLPLACSTWYILETCTDTQDVALQDGTAIVENDVVISPKGIPV